MRREMQFALKASEVGSRSPNSKAVNNHTVCYTPVELDLSERSGFRLFETFFDKPAGSADFGTKIAYMSV